MKKSNIKFLVMDVDGTLTDGKIYMGNDGELFKAFDIKDGCGIHDILPKHNIKPVIMTARKSNIVLNRCRELEIKHIYQGCHNKKEFLKQFLEKYGVIPENGKYLSVAYIGDDIIDLPVMEICGLTACPADAVDAVKKYVNYISSENGGNGAVRDFIEYICNNYV